MNNIPVKKHLYPGLIFLAVTANLSAYPVQTINSSGTTGLNGTGQSDGILFTGSAPGMVLNVPDGNSVNTNNHPVGVDTSGIMSGGSASIDFAGNASVYGTVANSTIPLTAINVSNNPSATVNFTGDVYANSLNFTGNSTVIVATNLVGNVYNTSGTNYSGFLYYTGDTTIGGNIGTSAADGALDAVAFYGNANIGYDIYSGQVSQQAGTATFTGANRIMGGSYFLENSGSVMNLGTTNVNVTANFLSQAGTGIGANLNYYGSSGSLAVGGAASVNSGTTLTVTAPTYAPNGAEFTVFTGGSGSTMPSNIGFDGTGAFGDFDLSTVGNSYVVTEDRTAKGFRSSAVTPNQASIGWALDNVTNANSDMQTQLNALQQLTRAQINNDLNTLLPEIDGGLQKTSFTALGEFSETAIDRLNDLRLTGQKATPGSGLWTDGYGSFLSQSADGESNGYNAEIFGTAVGWDGQATENLRLGAAFGYANTSIASRDDSDHTDSNSYQLALYGGYDKNDTYLDGDVLFGWNDYTTNRGPTITNSTQRVAEGDFNGEQYGTYWELGHNFERQGWQITPFASFEYQRLDVDSYTENNAGALDLNIGGQRYNTVLGGAGVRLSRDFVTRNGTWKPELSAQWLHDFADDAQSIIASFTGGGGSFAVSGPQPGRNMADLGVGLSFASLSHLTLGARCDLVAANDFNDETAQLNASWKF